MSRQAEHLPGYELEELLHDSSSSAVYRARREADGLRVVVKRTQGNVVSARQLVRYRNEFELLRSLASEGVIKAYELLRNAGQLALVLEEFDGVSLRQWLERRDPPLEERLAVASRLASTLGEVHAAGVIHKDVNSHNFLYDPATGHTKLIDFGIATRLAAEDGKFQFPAALEGTLAYIAPEQTGRMNRTVDHRADWYSLGVTLYELFSGRLPNEADDPLELVHFHIAGRPAPLAELGREIPEAVSDIVDKLMQKAPEDRYQSAAGIVADLRYCRERLRSTGRVERFAVGRSDALDRFEPPQKLYGREAEVAALLATFEASAAGDVRAVLVEGPAGSGKTSLVQEMYEPITRRRGYFAAGKFEQMQQDMPFSALVEAFQDLVEQLLTESEESIESWRARLRSAVGANGQVIVDVIPALELIIGPQPSVHPLPAVEAQNRFKLVFQSFIQVFARRSHPLVLFLDDMQWADAASLNLVTLILAAPATESLLVVQAYRDGEIAPAHPLALALGEQQERGVAAEVIRLRPLDARAVERFVADTLRREPAAVASLAAVVAEKTGGNPFFLRQFMQSLHAEGLLAFDSADQGFRYDLAEIESTAITENVAELVSAKLARLGAPVREQLKLAAAIGGRFDLGTLALVGGRAEAHAAELLGPALAAGLIMPTSRLETLDADALDSPLVYRRFAFLHDRVQKAAYDSITPAERPALHLAIGRVLGGETDGAAVEQRIFDVVGHMNHGIELIDAPAERRALAELNLRAGVKARNATAYELAVRCFRNTVALCGGNDAWRQDRALASEAHLRLAEGLCLTADYTAAFAVIDDALEHAESVAERAGLLALRVNAHASMGGMREALACGRVALETFRVELPVDAADAERLLEQEIRSILERTAAIGIENLLDLPAMEDPGRVALMSLMTNCLPAAYQTDQQLFALICCKMVSLSLEHGNCALSARAYGSFAALLVSALGRYADANRFAKLGVDLARKLDEPAVYAGAYFLWAMFASHWIEPADESLELFRQSVRFGLQSGDHSHAAYSAARRVSHRQFKGAQLQELRQEAVEAVALGERIGEAANTPFLQGRLRLIDWLCGERPHGHGLHRADASEEEFTAAARARGNLSFEADWLMMLARQRYLAGELVQAREFAEAAERLQPFAAGFITRSEHSFYYALILAALATQARGAERARIEAQIAARQRELAGWADNCEANFRHMQLLVDAELARVEGRVLEALELYDRSIACAAEHGFLHVEALAAELAARFWHDASKPDFGGLYVDRALHAYEIWGAHGRAADLRAVYGVVRRSPSSSITAGSTTIASAERGDALDLATVLKASQAISSEIVLERLLAKLLDIILENAGGDLAVLVLESGGEYLVQGVKSTRSERSRVLIGEPLRQSAALSSGIANYVLRTGEHVVLDEPAHRGKFRTDAYVRNRQPKSVLCAPIAHQGKLSGVVYLENGQLAGAFTPGRLEALNVLLAQIAVSIENARLYARQEQQARSIELANSQLTKEVAERNHAEQELSRYRDHLEELVAQRTRELASAQGRLVELSHRAGMAEVASGVLHNVGNVMNSVNVGAHVARDAVSALPVERLGSVCELLELNAHRLPDYLAADPAGRKIPEYLARLAEALVRDKQSIGAEIDHVLEHLEHMKKIIAAQQSYAKMSGVTEVCTLQEIAETALSISEAALRGSRVQVTRSYAELKPALLDRHQLLQIVVNLISNAKHALEEIDPADRRLTVAIAPDGDGARIEVRDNGVGIPRENLAKIFNHGFTTKKTGHGFGLHNCANAAQQMRGSLQAHSDGAGTGATFVLRIPLPSADGAVRRAGAA